MFVGGGRMILPLQNNNRDSMNDGRDTKIFCVRDGPGDHKEPVVSTARLCVVGSF